MLLNQKCQRRRHGAAAVEMAVAFSVFIIFVFAIIEFGRFIMIRQVVENATREGARLGIVEPTEAAITDRVNYFLAGQPINARTTAIARNPDTFADKPLANAGFGDMIVVQVNGTYSPMLPTFGFLPNTVPIQATAIMRCEIN